jgi:hypothetical protein
MEKPLALKLNSAGAPNVYRVSIDPTFRQQIPSRRANLAPAVLVTRKATILPEISAGLIDHADIISVTEGNWEDTVLVVLPEISTNDAERRGLASAGDAKIDAEQREPASPGDAEFLAEVKRRAPDLAMLADRTIAAVRAAGVEGELVKAKKDVKAKQDEGRWINRPSNTFTLKAQPRAGNLHFTLYGNPETFKSEGFLLKDQNSYSRGWVRNDHDVGVFAEFARQSYARRR